MNGVCTYCGAKKPTTVTITFHGNGGKASGETVYTQTVTVYKETALTTNRFMNDDNRYRFACWSTKDDGTGDLYPDGAKVTLENSLDLYARWAVEISDYAGLCDFADRVNGTGAYEGKTDSTACAVLTKDITAGKDWTPIGSDTQNYNGRFDGRGHTITGLNVSGEIKYAGLFGYVGEKGVVENLTVSGTVTSERKYSAYAGGVAGANFVQAEDGKRASRA